MKRILYGFLCEFSRTSFWPFRERQWTRQELLAITSVLSFLLLLTMLLLFLSRRWKKAIRAVRQDRLEDGGTGLSRDRNGGLDSPDSEEALAAHLDIERGQASKDSKPTRRQAKSGAKQRAAGKQEDSEACLGILSATETKQKRNKSDRRAARKVRYTIHVAAKSPKQMLAELAEDIRDLNLQNETSNRPDAKLDAALKALEAGRAGNKEAAIEALGELIDVVERERRDDDMVQQDDAEDLIDAAREIIKLLR